MAKSVTDQIEFTGPEEIGMQCAALHSRVFSRLVTRHYNNRLSKTGLRVTQFTILNAIKARPPESIQQLAELLGMERTSLQRAVDGLIDRGLVRAAPTGNKRSLGLGLTRGGESTYREAVRVWEAAHAEFTELVGAKNWQAMAKELRKMSAEVKHSL